MGGLNIEIVTYTYQTKDQRNVEQLYGLEVESQQEAVSA